MSAENTYVNKVVYGSDTLIDLTSDTAVENKVLSGYYFHKATGERVQGSCSFDVDSSSATAATSEVLATKTFAKNGEVLTGSMPNVGEQTGSISSKDQEVTINQGYHDGSGKIGLDATEKAKLIPGNIKSGVELFGVTGDHTGAESITSAAASVTPGTSQQVVLPTDLGAYDYISQVTVSAIPVTEVDNAAGGKTVTIAPVAA